jgi:hypothetical protein
MTPLEVPVARYRHAMAWADAVGKVVIWGGSGEAGPLSDGALYQPLEDVWSPIPAENAPSRRTEFGWALAGRYLVVFGGRSSGNVLAAQADEVLGDGGLYDLQSNRWQQLPSEGAPSPRYRLAAAASVDGRRVYFVGGLNADGPLTDAYVLDASVSPPQWASLPGSVPLLISTDPRPFMGEPLAAFATPQGLVAFSGLGDGGKSVRAASYAFPSGPWQLDVASLAPPARMGASVVLTGGFSVVIYGGHDPQLEPGEDRNRYLDDLAIFTPPFTGEAHANRWLPMAGVGSENVPRAFHGSAWTGSGIVVAGGLDPGHCGGAVLWDQDTQAWRRLSFEGSPRLGRMPGLLWVPRVARDEDTGEDIPGLVVFGSHRPASLSQLDGPAARWSP